MSNYGKIFKWQDNIPHSKIIDDAMRQVDIGSDGVLKCLTRERIKLESPFVRL